MFEVFCSNLGVILGSMALTSIAVMAHALGQQHQWAEVMKRGH